MQISKHFSLAELTATNTGLRNDPDNSIIDNISVMAKGLEKVREIWGKPVTVSSGYRSPAVNSAVGGANNSAHLTGYAADITIPGLTNKQICQGIVRAGIKFDQLIDENKGGRQWVHISFDPKMRGEWLIFSNGKYEVHQ